jgi:hypothetical protein
LCRPPTFYNFDVVDDRDSSSKIFGRARRARSIEQSPPSERGTTIVHWGVFSTASFAHRTREDIMAGITKKSFGAADEVRTPAKTHIEVVDLGGVKAARMTLEPGWRWSECIKPIAGTDSCQIHHVGTLVAGSMHIVHDDGTEQDVAAGDAYEIEPGHDAWVTSVDSVVGFEFDTTAPHSFARPIE